MRFLSLLAAALPGSIVASYANKQLLNYAITNKHEVEWPLEALVVPQQAIYLEILVAMLLAAMFFLLFLFLFYQVFSRSGLKLKIASSLLLCSQVAMLYPIARHMIVGITII